MIAAMLRIKNEASWIRRVLQSCLAVCDQAFVLDDHSTDDTAAICRSIARVTVYDSPFSGLNETRDKDFLLHQVRNYSPAWVLCIDGDELLPEPSIRTLVELLKCGTAPGYSLRILYLWDSPVTVRTDGVYGRFRRPSLFRIRGAEPLSFSPMESSAVNFHCTNVPHQLWPGVVNSQICLLHFGYMEQAERRRKFDWYNAIDPHNASQDCYQHCIQGDPGGPDPGLKLKHAGPLKLAPLESLCA
jgi:Glycosyl transferase family 2